MRVENIEVAPIFLSPMPLNCLRAEQLYTLYTQVLRQAKSRVSVSCINLEEQEHLQEMSNALGIEGLREAEQIVNCEEKLFQKWLLAIKKQFILIDFISLYMVNLKKLL